MLFSPLPLLCFLKLKDFPRLATSLLQLVPSAEGSSVFFYVGLFNDRNVLISKGTSTNPIAKKRDKQTKKMRFLFKTDDEKVPYSHARGAV